MTRKTEACYIHLFEYIDEYIMKLMPASFMTDFERAMRNALKKVWPLVDLFTCWFHYCQAIKKHSSQIPEFMGILRGEPSTLKTYYEIMCLPLLPSHQIQDAYNEIKLEATTRYGELYSKFMRYVESQWLKKVIVDNCRYFSR